jgi:hypothetical protein
MGRVAQDGAREDEQVVELERALAPPFLDSVEREVGEMDADPPHGRVDGLAGETDADRVSALILALTSPGVHPLHAAFLPTLPTLNTLPGACSTSTRSSVVTAAAKRAR